MTNQLVVFVLFCFVLASSLLAQTESTNPIGSFTAATDVGNIKGLHGNVQFDAVTETYTLKGSGANIWGKEDAFFFVYMPIDRDFDLSTFQTLLNEGATEHRKAGIMFRETLESDSACVFITVHGDGLTSMQFREKQGDTMLEDSYAVKDSTAKFISLTREGDLFIVQVGTDKLDSATAKKREIKIAKKGYLGFFICSHSTNDYERVKFCNLQFNTSKE